MGGGRTVSIVVATHRRPDALATALRSVVAQDHEDWELLVVGDGCDARTAAVVAALADPRARYVDLPDRFGEQSGPNSVGLALARGDFVAFLNHDDLLTSDHFTRALAALDAEAGEFYVARSAFTQGTARDADGGERPAFTQVGPTSRDPGDCFLRRHHLFEPCSAWVVRMELARELGPWRPARELYRTPLQDWMLRAWRRRARFVLGEEVTVLCAGSHRSPGPGAGASYARESPEHAWLGALVEQGPEAVRAAVARDLAHRRDPVRRWPSNPFDVLFVNRATRTLYRWTGLDAHDAWQRWRGQEKGRRLDQLSRERTGEPLPPPPDLEAVLRRLEARESPTRP